MELKEISLHFEETFNDSEIQREKFIWVEFSGWKELNSQPTTFQYIHMLKR